MMRWLLPLLLHTSQAEDRINVALHAQAPPTPGGYVVGSVMTTNGLKKALLRTGRVREARSFYPFHYHFVNNQTWDLLIIEGWFESSAAVIHEFRRHSPRIVVFYWCLDPLFPGLSSIASLDVDGYLTNSREVAEELSKVAPASFVPLAADMAEMSTTTPYNASGPYVYVGSALGVDTKKNLVQMLREAQNTSRGLELWGSGWNDVGPPDLLKSYRGLLPHGELANCYSKAGAVLGATMDGQRDKGMVNNRVFEVLAAGRPLVQEAFPELVELLKDAPSHNLVLWHKAGDVPRGEFTRNETATSYISKHHTYDSRALDVLAHFDSLRDNHRRTGALRVAVLWNGAWTPILQTSIAAAADGLERLYRIFWVRVADVVSQSVDLLHYDVIFAVGSRNSPSDICARSLVREWTLPRHLEQRRLWILLDDGDVAPGGVSCFPDRVPRNASQAYDAVVFAEESDRSQLIEEGFHPLQLQEGYGVAPFPPKALEDDGDDAYDAVVFADARDITTQEGRMRVVNAARRTQNSLVAVVGESVMISAVSQLKRELGAVDMRLIGNDAIVQDGVLDRAARSCSTIIVPHGNASWGGDWAVAYAAAVAREGATVLITDPTNTRLHRLASMTSNGIDTLSDALSFGVTRALTLGRGASKATIISAEPSQITNGDVRFAIDFESFVTGRDGSWCLVADTSGMLTCVLQRHLDLVLRVEAPPNCEPFDVSFYVELKSNVYGDVLRRSDAVSVRVGGGNATEALPAYPRTEVLLWPFKPACPAA